MIKIVKKPVKKKSNITKVEKNKGTTPTKDIRDLQFVSRKV